MDFTTLQMRVRTTGGGIIRTKLKIGSVID